MGFKEFLLGELKKVKSFNDLKYVDKRLSIPVGTFIVLFLIAYYYYILFIYPQQTKASRIKAAREATKNVPIAKSMQKAPVENVETNVQTPATDAGMQLYRIPGTHMDTSSIPPDEIVLYTDVFNTLFSFFDNINHSNYGNASVYLDKNFVASNKITDDLFEKYCKDTYYRYNDFYIQSVTKNADSSYTAKLSIRNKQTESVGFFTTLNFVSADNGLYLTIDDIVKYKNSVNK